MTMSPRSKTPKTAAKRKSAAGKPAKKSAPKKPAAKKTVKAAELAKTPTTARQRDDLNAPIDGFFAKQPAALRPIVDALRSLVEEAAPDARSATKWGMPFFMIDDNMLCAIGGHKAHVNLILPGPPGTFDDPDGLLVGDGKTGRRLILKTLADLPKASVKKWLHTAVKRAREGKSMVLR